MIWAILSQASLSTLERSSRICNVLENAAIVSAGPSDLQAGQILFKPFKGTGKNVLVAANGPQWGVDLVSQPDDQQAERRHLLGPHQLQL
jgi:hypothetical protein